MCIPREVGMEREKENSNKANCVKWRWTAMIEAAYQIEIYDQVWYVRHMWEPFRITKAHYLTIDENREQEWLRIIEEKRINRQKRLLLVRVLLNMPFWSHHVFTWRPLVAYSWKREAHLESLACRIFRFVFIEMEKYLQRGRCFKTKIPCYFWFNHKFCVMARSWCTFSGSCPWSSGRSIHHQDSRIRAGARS